MSDTQEHLTVRSIATQQQVALALISGGDSRLAVKSHTGLNKYLCPAYPDPDLICASSCTASPISPTGFRRAAALFDDLSGAPSPAARLQVLQNQTRQIESVLLRYFHATGLARVTLCQSGTDALLMAATRIAAEQPDVPMTAILPCVAETGTGVPFAAAGQHFDGDATGQPAAPCDIRTVEVPLRSQDGSPVADDRINHAYAAAASRARGRVVVYLTYGTKTGLIAPRNPPTGAEVIVDACQARINPALVAAYLGNGWPVVVTGSKFFGGPAFSGAVLFPTARRARNPNIASAPNLGTLLRWTAALDGIENFQSVAAQAGRVIRDRGTAIRRAIEANPALLPIEGQTGGGRHWSDQPSIFTFAVRDHSDRTRLLSAGELRPLYTRLASAGILLGQPVGLGRFGGLRVAIGAREIADAPDPGFNRLLTTISNLTASTGSATARASQPPVSDHPDRGNTDWFHPRASESGSPRQ